MSWLLHLSCGNGLADRLIRDLDPLWQNVEVCRSLQDLSQRCRGPTSNFKVMVLCFESKEALREIFSLENFLRDKKIILILPDEDKDTMTMGFKLFPRFITWVDGDFRDLAIVLKKMLDLYDIPVFSN